MRATFKNLCSDVNWLDYGGTWYRKINATTYHVMVLTNMIEAVGERENEGHPKYVVELREVDLDSPDLEQARRCCGYEDPTTLSDVYSLQAYGAFAPLGDWSGNNARKLMTECRAESAALADPDHYEQAMARPVNKIGSTAREYQQGDIRSAVLRGLAEGRTDAVIMAKMGGLR
jgi:hypothetical protein